MDATLGQLTGLVLPAVAIVAVFTFVAVAVWSDNRRKEREAYYREETYKKLADNPGESGNSVLEVLREEEARRARQRLEGQRLGGLITTASGAGVMIFLYLLVPDERVYTVGLIPLLIGLVLAVYGYLLAPSPEQTFAPRRGERD